MSVALVVIDVPVLVLLGEDDRICPFPTTGARSVKLLKHGTAQILPRPIAWNASHARRHRKSACDFQPEAQNAPSGCKSVLKADWSAHRHAHLLVCILLSM
jgi:hypothetical protein